MNQLHFVIINTIADLPELHTLSDAGCGSDTMHLTPARDSELILYGRSLTALPDHIKPQALLSNGGISPALLVHGLCAGLHQHGWELHFTSMNVGVPAPKPSALPSPFTSITHFGDEHGAAPILQPLLQQSLLRFEPESCVTVLAECGVGGTMFSTLWLRGLSQLPLLPAGSTQHPDKLARKAVLLSQLTQQHMADGFQLARMLSTPHAQDQLQILLCELVRHWPANKPLPYFAGGMMMLAPLWALAEHDKLPQAVQIYTTRWALHGDPQQLLPLLPSAIELHGHQTNFLLTTHHCLHRYEQGHVVEGCGLGAILGITESAYPESTIIHWLDDAVSQYLQHFSE